MKLNIIKTTVRDKMVTIELNNGVKFAFAVNPDYLHVSVSGVDKPIEVFEKWANGMNISYTPRS
jgi:hypothetical protein